MGARVRVGLERLRRATGPVACRISRYQRRSRSGCSTTSESSSATTSAGWPSSISVAMRSSSATRRSSSSRLVSVWAQSSNANSASAGPRHSSRARTQERSPLSRSTHVARPRAVVRTDARRAARARPGARIPGGRVTSTSGPRPSAARRSRSGATSSPFRRVVPIELVDELLRRHDLPRAQQQGASNARCLGPPRTIAAARPSPRAGRGSERKASVERL